MLLGVWHDAIDAMSEWIMRIIEEKTSSKQPLTIHWQILEIAVKMCKNVHFLNNVWGYAKEQNKVKSNNEIDVCLQLEKEHEWAR